MNSLQKLRSLFRKGHHEAEMPMEMMARPSGPREWNSKEVRDQWARRWLEHAARDVRFSFRSLRRSPVFSLTVVATLALCIGANTSIVSVLYGLIIRPLPFPNPGQIV